MNFRKHLKQSAKDMDLMMLGGCSTFLISAFAVWGISLWPFFAFQFIERLTTLLLCLGLGILPGLVFGSILSRKGSLPGACGFIAGAVCVGVFLKLRLGEANMAAAGKYTKPLQWPSWLEVVAPLTYGVIAISLALLLVPPPQRKGELAAERPD